MHRFLLRTAIKPVLAPSGLDIIVASALKSSSTKSIGGLLVIGRDTKSDVDSTNFIVSAADKFEVRLISIDAAPKVKSQTAGQTSNMTRDMVRRNLDASNYIGQVNSLLQLAALNAGLLGTKVLLLHGQIQTGEATVSDIGRKGNG